MVKNRFLYIFLMFVIGLMLMGSRPAAPAFAPGAFVKLSPTSGSISQPTTITLTWATSEGATSYEYCLRTNTNCSNKWVNVGGLTSITVSGLTPNTRYYWQVRATDSTLIWTYADGSEANRWNFTTQPLPGAFGKTPPPANGAVDQPVNGLVLNWTASANANFYEYCVDDTDNDTCNTTWISTGSTPSVTVSNLLPSTVLYWQVRAVNNSGTVYADGGTWWSFSTTSVLPGLFNKTMPENGATYQPVNSLSLSWEASAHAASYQYCIDEIDNGVCDTSWTPNGLSTTALVSGLPYDTLFYWQVQSVNNDGSVDANEGTWWSFRTQIAPPAAFGKMSPGNNAVNVEAVGLELSWEASPGAERYEYCFDTTDDNTCSTWTSVTTTSSGSLECLYNTTYFWQVRAVNSTATVQANNGFSWTFTTRPAPPGVFYKTMPADGASVPSLSPVLSWTASGGTNVTYEYCYDTISNSTCEGFWFLAGAETQAALSGLQFATTYYWQVRALSSAYVTYADAGEWWSFTTPGSPPGAFGKASPQDSAAEIVSTPNLSWSHQSGRCQL